MTTEIKNKQLNSVKCLICGNPINSKRNDSRYCSNKCRQASFRRKQSLQIGVTDMSNPANLKDYLEAMIRYHHKSGIGCINAEYNSKKNKRIKKVAPELLKELVEAKTWNNASWHRGAVNGLLEVYDIMHFGKTGATLLEEIPGITDSDILYAEVN